MDLQARKYERDLDARLAAFAKLCSSSPGDFKRKGETGLAAEQASQSPALSLSLLTPASWAHTCVHRVQLAQAKALEIEGLLERLSDINSRMSSQLGGVTDTQSHTVANHKDKLHDYSQASCAQMLQRLYLCRLPSYASPWPLVVAKIRPC